MNPATSTHQLQMQALREALERSARAAALAEEMAIKTLSDLQAERNRTKELEKEVARVVELHAMVMNENRRLRNLLGQACVDRQSITFDIQALLKELRASTEPEATPDVVVVARQVA